MPGPLNRAPFDVALRAAVAADTGRPVGYGRLPVNPDGSAVSLPYYVLYPLLGTSYGGPPLVDANEDTVWRYQLVAVADAEDMLQAARDRARRTFLDRLEDGSYRRPFAPAGYREVLREPADEGGTEPQGRMVSAADRYTVHVTRSDP